MGSGYRPASGTLASRLRGILACCRRALIPHGPPVDLHDEPPPLPEDDLELERLGQRFSNDLFARLLLELPAHRRTLASAYTTGDYRCLRDSIHQLLGATAYCDAPELDDGLRELQRALQSGDRDSVDRDFMRVLNSIDDTLRSSGCSGN